MTTKHLTAILMLGLATTAFAADEHYDGSDPLLCTNMTTRQCGFSGCDLVDVESLGAPRYVIVDFKEKVLSSTEYSTQSLLTPIGSYERKDNRLVLQGVDERSKEAEDALAWTMVIAAPTGMMTFTVAGEETAFVIFGACTPIE
jgi:hypothetical protein